MNPEAFINQVITIFTIHLKIKNFKIKFNFSVLFTINKVNSLLFFLILFSTSVNINHLIYFRCLNYLCFIFSKVFKLSFQKDNPDFIREYF